MSRTEQLTHGQGTEASGAKGSRGRWLALSVLVLAVLLVAVDATVLGLATPSLSEDLKPSGTQLLAFLVTENQLFEGDQVNDGWARLDARVSALFRRGQTEGDIRIDLSPAWLTEALYGLIGTCAWAVMDGRVAAKDFQYMIIELLLGGARRSVEK